MRKLLARPNEAILAAGPETDPSETPEGLCEPAAEQTGLDNDNGPTGLERESLPSEAPLRGVIQFLRVVRAKPPTKTATECQLLVARRTTGGWLAGWGEIMATGPRLRQLSAERICLPVAAATAADYADDDGGGG